MKSTSSMECSKKSIKLAENLNLNIRFQVEILKLIKWLLKKVMLLDGETEFVNTAEMNITTMGELE